MPTSLRGGKCLGLVTLFQAVEDQADPEEDQISLQNKQKLRIAQKLGVFSGIALTHQPFLRRGGHKLAVPGEERAAAEGPAGA